MLLLLFFIFNGFGDIEFMLFLVFGDEGDGGKKWSRRVCFYDFEDIVL